MRWAVIGDVGGQLDALRQELARLGADPDAGTIPEDLTLVQVGDLVHRGPDSVGVLQLVDLLMRRNPGRWVQLVGNHEAQYLRRPVFAWPERLDDDAAALLREWWNDGLMVVAAVVPTSGGDVLATHAGITEGFWREDLAGPESAHDAARLLNHPAVRDAAALFRPGVMLTGDVNPRVGPIWAEAASELVAGWLDKQLPFGQVHGHSSLVDWSGGDWRADESIRERTLLDLVACHETTLLTGGAIVGIDPGHGAQPRSHWHAWEPAQAAWPGAD